MSNIIYLESSVSFTENDTNLRLGKAWTVIDWLSIILKSNLSDKIKRNFFLSVVASILLYGCTIWTLTKRIEKKLDGKCTRMSQAILNKSWKQHPTEQQLYRHLPLNSKTIQIRWTRHMGLRWRSKVELISDVLLLALSHGRSNVRRPVTAYW